MYRKLKNVTGIAALCALILSLDSAAFAGMDPGGPRELKKEGAVLVYYQLQIDSWKNYRDLNCARGVYLTPPGGKAISGVASLKAKTMVDNE